MRNILMMIVLFWCGICMFCFGNDAKQMIENGNIDDAIDVLKKECKKNKFSSCHNLGLLFLETNFKNEAIAVFKKACNNNIYESCKI